MTKRLSKARFEALSFSRKPQAELYAEELEWYSDKDENVIATLIRDRIDYDFGYIILGRDERALFRSIDANVSFEDIVNARQSLKEKIAEYALKGDIVFPQGDSKRKKNLIFEQIVTDKKLHPHFRSLTELEEYSPAKEIIGEIVYAFEDADGNYIEQFQSTGFNARLWELYLYAFFHEEDFEILREYSAPDYICTKFGETICIEAVTVNPTDKARTNKKSSLKQIQKKLKNFIPIKFGSALFSKLRKKYWEKEHIKGKSLIFAIQDFHEEGSMVWSGSGLINYLYGYHYISHKDEFGKLTIIPKKIKKHKYGKKEIPSGFFFLPDAENISAVLFNNSATIAKFNRMGKLADFGSQRVRMIRTGTCHNHDPNASEPLAFKMEVDPNNYDETWGESLSLFHNPTAIYPVDPMLFPNIAHHYFEDGFITSDLPEFHPLGSYTRTFI